METVDELLQNYQPGDPINKPDVLKQIKEIEEERKKMMQQQSNQSGKIVLNQNGKHIELNNEQIVQIMQKQQEQLQELSRILMEKDKVIENLNNQLNNSYVNNSFVKNSFIEIPNISEESNNSNKDLKENITKLIQLLDNKKNNLN